MTISIARAFVYAGRRLDCQLDKYTSFILYTEAVAYRFTKGKKYNVKAKATKIIYFYIK